MIDASFVNALIAHASHPVVVDVDGRKHLALPLPNGAWELSEAPSAEVLPQTLSLATLTGLVDYVKANRDALPLADCVVHVASHECVELRGKLTGEFKQRATYLRAVSTSVLGTTFVFGTFYDVEKFNVALQSLFVSTPERDEVLRVLGTIKENSVRQTDDDGITQTVTASAGVALVTEARVPSPVVLKPFRTFRELEQPASPFILRLRPNRDGDKPVAALFEADGGAWKLVAIQNVARYLREALPELAVIA